ncbi:MAG: hypothetical protein AAGF07_04390, partial [Patescibacteria group bacterium]
DGSCRGDLLSAQVVDCTYDSTTRTLTWNVGNMSRGQAGRITFDVRVNTDAEYGIVFNTAVIDSNETDPDDSTYTVDIVPTDIVITKTVSEGLVVIDKTNPEATELDYTIQYGNETDQPLTGVVITDTLDSRLVFVSCSDDCTYDEASRQMTWNIGNLESTLNSTQPTVTFKVKLNNAHDFAPNEYIPNTAIIDSNETDPRDSTVTTLVKYFDVSIIKTVSKDLVSIGEEYTYYVEFTNTTENILTNAVITDQLTDNRIEYVTGSCSGNCTYDSASRTLTWTRPSLAPNQTEKVEFKVRVLTGVNVFGDIVNTAKINTDQTPEKESTVNVKISNIINDPIRTGGIAIPFALVTLVGFGSWRFLQIRKKKNKKISIDLENNQSK